MKKRLAGQKFDTDDEMKWAVWSEMARLTKEGGQEGLRHVFDKWEVRLKKVIACNGDYIEK